MNPIKNIFRFSLLLVLLLSLAFLCVFATEINTSKHITQVKKDYIAEEREFIDLMHVAVKNDFDQVDISKFQYTTYDVQKMVEYYSYEHPETALYYLVYDLDRNDSNSEYIAAINFYANQKNNAKKYEEKIDEWANNVIEQIPSTFTEKEKVDWINDYIIRNYEYDKDLKCRDLYDMIESGKGVCTGYTQMFTVLAKKAGLEVSFAMSEPLRHVWNVVKVDGKWYNIDVTWNDSSGQHQAYFLLSDIEIQIRHEYSGPNATVTSQYFLCDSNFFDN